MTDPAAGGPTRAPGTDAGGGEGATLLITATGMLAISAPTALQVIWLIAVCGVSAARAVGRRASLGGAGGPGGPAGPTDAGSGGVPPQ